MASNHANVTSYFDVQLFLLWNISNITKIIRFTIVPLDFASLVGLFTAMMDTDKLRPRRLAFKMEWVSENSGMQSGQTMMNTLLFLVDENSNPQQEFGILIFFAAT